MIEIPIDFVRSGDILGKHQAFKKYDGGMSSSVNLMKGYMLTQKVIEKLKSEFNVEHICIADDSETARDVNYEEGIDEIERQKIVDAFIQNMNKIKSLNVIDLAAMSAIVTDILNSVFRFVKSGGGSFRTIAKAFSDVQTHDTFTWDHSVNTAIYAAVLALKMPGLLDEPPKKFTDHRFSRHEILVFNMLFHDVGKTKVPLKILNKSDKLDDTEIETLKRHPYNGLVHLRKINEELKASSMPLIPAYFYKACLLHHQAYDGSGYPALRHGPDDIRPYKGLEIPPIGRLAAVADIYDAVTSMRPHRLPFHPVEALSILKSEKGKKLDPEIADALLDTLTPFPKGSTVMLTTDELAVVVSYLNGNKLYPVVRPYMRKVYKQGKERIVRLPYRESIEIHPDSKIKIVINKDIYELENGRDKYP